MGQILSQTSFACDDLTNIAIFSAMHVRKEGRESRHGNVFCEDIELFDTVPSCAFGGEHVDQEDFGLDVLMTPPSFEYRQWLRDCQG